ncbi:MAG: AprI/Inh family metalloprotease inhibitor [Rhodobacteraceae bacterium]|nr:AprI/Inh family metalloprotease inhibitor [Paracoccaceae bacterium]
MSYKTLIAIGAAIVLAGCEMEGAPQSTSPAAAPAQQRAIMPAAPATGGQISDTSTRTTTTVSGNTTRTETTSTTVGVNAGGFLAALAGGAGSAPNTSADYTGTWNVTSPNNRQCRMTLRAPATAAGPAMVSNQGCFQELFNVSRWSLRGSELVLTDGFGTQIVSLRATERNRLQGGEVTMWR